MLEALRAIVGDKGLVTDPAEMEPYLVDWRQRRRGAALAVVQPSSTAEVSAVVALCAAQGQPIFPVGGNTGLCFGAVPESNRPDKPGIMLSLRRMNRIRGLDRASGIATVDAGVVLGDLHNAAAEAGRQFPLHLGSEGSAQIGGLISTNAGGTGVVRYGPMRDLVAGLEVVLADGRVLSDLAALRKDNTGYMLRHLFIGAEGSLGIVTGAALRLHPQTPNTAHAWVAAADPADAVALLAALQDRAGSYIQAFELVSASQFELVRKHAERVRFPFAEIPAWSVLIELGSEDATTALRDILEEVLGAALEQGELLDAVIATSEQQAADFWHIRHSVSEANKKEGMSITHDVAVRSSHVAPFIKAADEVAAKLFPEAYSEVVCHLGDGNVHYILMFTHAYWAALPDAEAFALEVERAIHDVAARFGGTFSAEHGVGRKLTEELERLADPLRYELMTKVKALFDPQGLMNPGVLLAPKQG
ncbi:FAD-binding oxidoreductase [uncultured Bosea sp.]|uniref:FAD-binding oxidoreductase n=1 Tax=uncultured Bosea sp. TaxID=211457 RepID=UPI0025E96A3E|nr:FAD-binding oxidoreductase [uncultured Bosea sp.]